MERVLFDDVSTNMNVSILIVYIIEIANNAPETYITCIYDAQWLIGKIPSQKKIKIFMSSL